MLSRGFKQHKRKSPIFGMLRVVCNNYRGGKLLQLVHIYYDSNKTRESCVVIGYFIHLGVFMCFYKIVYMYPGIR